MKRFLLLSVLLACCVCAKAVTIMNGPSASTVGSQEIYSISFDPTTEEGKSFRVDISDNGRLIDTDGNLVKSLTITPTNMIWPVFVKWQSAGDGYIQITQKDNIDNTDKFNVKVLNLFDLEIGYSGEPLIIKVSNSSPKQFQRINISIEEHYVTNPTTVEWTIDGETYSDNSTSIYTYFPTMGTKNISAKIHFYGTSETKSISTTVTVGAGAPDLAGAHIFGNTNLGVGSQMQYSISEYSANDVEYSWTIIPNRNINILSSSDQSFSVVFLKAGFYTIRWEAKDKRTGVVGTPASLSVTVSDDGPIVRRAEDPFKASLEGSTLRIIPTDKKLTKAANKAQYTLSNLTTGTVVSTGYVNKEAETYIDVSALRNGMYVLYIQVDAESMKPYKFMLKK